MTSSIVRPVGFGGHAPAAPKSVPPAPPQVPRRERTPVDPDPKAHPFHRPPPPRDPIREGADPPKPVLETPEKAP